MSRRVLGCAGHTIREKGLAGIESLNYRDKYKA